jgi:hypothetical protein
MNKLKSGNKELDRSDFIRMVRAGKLFYGCQLKMIKGDGSLPIDEYRFIDSEGSNCDEITSNEVKELQKTNRISQVIGFVERIESKHDFYSFHIKVNDVKYEDRDDERTIVVYTTAYFPEWFDENHKQLMEVAHNMSGEVTQRAVCLLLDEHDGNLKFKPEAIANDTTVKFIAPDEINDCLPH